MMKELSDGLVLRNAQPYDLAAILDHVRDVHGDAYVGLTESIYTKRPDFTMEDSFIVSDPKSGKVVSHLVMLKSKWALDRVEIPILQMELAGTRRSHRRQGLIRRLNQAYETHAKDIGAVVLIVAGTPYFYKLFDYVYAVPLSGGMYIPAELIPEAQSEQRHPISIEQVSSSNFLEFLDFRERYIPTKTWYRVLEEEDYEYLAYEDIHPKSLSINFYIMRQNYRIIGCFILRYMIDRLELQELYLQSPHHVLDVLRYAKEKAVRMGGLSLRVSPPNQLTVKEMITAGMRSEFPKRDAWYVKIPSIIKFLDFIGPVLTKRHEGSDYQDYSGEIVISSYRNVYSLQFENGMFQKARELNIREVGSYDAAMPPEALVKLLMGYESIDELGAYEPDVLCRAPMKSHLRILFPKLNANVNPAF